MFKSRREFLKSAGSAGAAVVAGSSARVYSSAGQVPTGQELRMVQTPILDIGYEEWGGGRDFPIILLHGFPYDIRAWDGVAPPLADAGYRVLVPYLRGYGHTRFRDRSAPRMAQQAAIGQDVIDFANALGLDEFALAGFDWGLRAACITSILHPERVRALVAVGGYSVQDTVSPSNFGSAVVEARLWYQWYFNMERGRTGLENNRREICRYLWETWSPGWQFSDETYERSAVSFDNPDFVDVVIHSYRHRHRNAPGEERFLEVERQLAERPSIQVPAIVLRGARPQIGRLVPDGSGDRDRFTNLEATRLVERAGHDLPAQRPDTVSAAFLELLG